MLTPRRAQRRDHLRGRVAVDREGDDRPELLAAVVDGDARPLGEPRAQVAGQRAHAVADRLEADAERVVGRHAEPDLGRDVRLPVLEAAGVGADDVASRRAATRRPGGRATAARAARSARGGRRGSRCRAGRAGTCARWRRACRSRSRRRRPASARPTGRRRAAAARRPRGRRRRPRRRAGRARPGSARARARRASTRSSSIARAGASTSTWPCSSSGTTTTAAPVRSATCRIGM